MLRKLGRLFVLSPLAELGHRPPAQIPELDALRTLAVVLVLGEHLTGAYLNQGGTENLFSKLPFVRGGWIGVDLFFVLSGYLIGKQLWREVLQTGTLNVGRFILRRGLRIWPLYFFFLIFVIAVLGRGGFPFGKWWSDPIFLTNYLNQGVVMGSWSLCTEEQFYIVAPLVLLIGAAWPGSIGRYRKYLLGLLVLLPVIRALVWWRVTTASETDGPELWMRAIYQPFHTHSDGLVMGLLISNWQAMSSKNLKPGLFASGWCVAGALVLCIGLQKLQREVLDFTGITLLFGAMVYFLLARPATRWLAPLRSWPFYLLSRLSYGMYLNHEYMANWVADVTFRYLPFGDRLPALNNAAGVILLTIISAGVAAVTFCVVEHPFLKLRDYLLRRKVARERPTEQVVREPVAQPA
jgi:peptidoglycan/LPS O-acetylase OafA/YrhL